MTSFFAVKNARLTNDQIKSAHLESISKSVRKNKSMHREELTQADPSWRSDTNAEERNKAVLFTYIYRFGM